MEMIGFTLPKQHATSNYAQWPEVNQSGPRHSSPNPVTLKLNAKSTATNNNERRASPNDNGNNSLSTRDGTYHSSVEPKITPKRRLDESHHEEPATKRQHNSSNKVETDYAAFKAQCARDYDGKKASTLEEPHIGAHAGSNVQASMAETDAVHSDWEVIPDETQNFSSESLKQGPDSSRPLLYSNEGYNFDIMDFLSTGAIDKDSITLPDNDDNSDLGETGSHALSGTVDRLRSENSILRKELDILRGRFFPPVIPPRQRTIYRVICDCHVPFQTAHYDDVPSFVGLGNSGHVAGRSVIFYLSLEDPASFGSSVVLAVFKIYRCSTSTSSHTIKSGTSSLLPPRPEDLVPRQRGECMALIGETTQKIFTKILSKVGVAEHLPDISDKQEISAPYVFFHQNREAFRLSAEREKFTSPQEVQVIMDYLESFQPEFDYADELRRKGQVCLETIHYLFKPGQLIVLGPLGSDSLAAYTESYLQNGHDLGEFKIKAQCWRYDGNFWLDRRTIKLDLSQPHEITSILDMECLPLDQTPKQFQESLRLRGLQFWQCRKTRYVRYESSDSYDVRMNDPRYMIDYDVWNAHHKGQAKSSKQDQSEKDKEKEYLAPELLANDQPPTADFLYSLPSKIMGFHMLNKKWQILNVAGISDVQWNKKAFESLVVENDTKEFIQALVTQRLSLDRSTDLIEGKGNSLVILLHGGPGTGKTLTAESVAELAEKPLYRVTCGDIGTDPVNVERRLQNVLYLGKAWGCVVLLDEADIFLEERRSHDLSRNALVSVFLRALEYYDGILILTTNRVGTFDEAFKSRIQLSVRYNNLSEQQRLKIWENFFKRLEDIDEEHVDVSDLRRHGRELAKHKMNGRQIRNSLTNARQLASYKEERMDITHLRRAIDVFIKFEDYTREIKQGVTDDDIARECGVR